MARVVQHSAVWLRGATQLRRRRRSWLALALLIGLAGGFVVAAGAGARRTTTAYDRLLATSRPFDLVLAIECPEGDADEEGCPGVASASLENILGARSVADATVVENYLVPVLTEAGFSIQPQEEVFGSTGEPPGEVCFTGNGEVDVTGSPGGRFGTELNIHRFVAGRAADPARADEAVMSVAAARRAGVGVGDSLDIVPVDACGELSPDEWPTPFTVTVVGLHVAPGEVQPEAGRYLQSVSVTPPLLKNLTASIGGNESVAVVLRDGATTEELIDELDAAGLSADVLLAQEEFSTAVRRGLRPDALTLWLLAGLGSAATVIVLGQALARQAWSGADELPTLRAMGFTSRDLTIAGAVEGAAVAVVAGISTIAFAIATSPLFPIGRARVAEPEPGIRVDPVALGVGAALVAIGSFAVVVGTARFVATRTAGAAVRPHRVSATTILLGRLGARPPAVVGTRMALERGHGARGVPVRSSFVGIGVGVGALVGSLTFGANLNHLLGTPSLVGWNWDLAYFEVPESGEPDVDRTQQADDLVRAARGIPGVERAGYATFFPPILVPLIDELPDIWPLSFSSGPGSIAPTVMSGRAPAAPDELLVSPSVLADLGLQVGDALDLRGARETDSGFDPITETVTIVGTGALPIGDGQFERAAAVTYAGMAQLAPDVEPQLILVDVAGGADRAQTMAALSELGLTQPLDSDHVNVTALVDLDVGRADDLPRLIGGLMAVLAIGVLIHLTYSGVRANRLDLATLRSVGFTRAQTATAIAWQTTTAVALPFAAGAIAGAVAGRGIWLAYADGLGVARATVVAWRPSAGFLIAFLVVANVIGLVVGQAARRVRPADVLRSE